jgi:hypothetical protein
MSEPAATLEILGPSMVFASSPLKGGGGENLEGEQAASCESLVRSPDTAGAEHV